MDDSALARAADRAPAAALRSQLRIALAADQALDPRATLFGQDQGQLARTADGMEVNIPAGAGRYLEAGMSLDLALTGDFEITADYELLSVDEPAVGAGAGIALELLTAKPGEAGTRSALFSRVVVPGGRQLFAVEQVNVGSADNRQQLSAPATQKHGRLRLTRSGSALHYQAIEGKSSDSREVGRLEFVSDDIRILRLLATNGNSTAGLRVRLSQFAIRAARLAPPGPSVLLIDGRQVPGRPAGLADGKLQIKNGEHGEAIPLAEIAAIALQPASPAPKAVTATTSNSEKDQAGPAKSDPGAETQKTGAKNNEAKKENRETQAEANRQVAVHLDRQDVLSGELEEISDTLIRLKAAWGPVELPLLKVRGLISLAAAHEDREAYSGKLKSPENQDVIFARAKEGKTTSITGGVLGLAAGKLRVTYEGAERSISQPRVLAIVFAARPTAQVSLDPFQAFQFRSGEHISGKIIGASPTDFQVELADGVVSRLPQDQIDQVTCHNGKLIYLSDLEPISLEETGYFGRGVPYRRDQSLAGGPLAIEGQTFDKGLAVRARSVLVYQIDGRFESFRATVGFDPSAGGRGRIRCRVLGDGRPLLVNDNLTAQQGPTEIEVSVTGIRRLTLEADFGLDEDVGDLFVWGQARIYRAGTAPP